MCIRDSYKDLQDFTKRVEISTKQIDLLIRVGAFRFTNKSKGELMWEKGAYFNQGSSGKANKTTIQTLSLFSDEAENFVIPKLPENEHDQAFDEMELLGFPLCSPYELVRQKQTIEESLTAANLKRHIGKQVKIVGYYVCRKNVRTVKGDMMMFGTWLDCEGQFFDTTHFSKSLELFPVRGKGIYQIIGRVTQEFDFPSVEVARMIRLPYLVDRRFDSTN